MTPEHLAFYLAQLDAETAARVVAEADRLRPAPDSRPPSRWGWLVERAAAHAGVAVEALLLNTRRRPALVARAAVVVVLRDVCEASWHQIGDAIQRDHTTAMHAYRTAGGDRYEPELSTLRPLLVADVLGREAA